MASEAERKKVALRRLGDATFSKVDKVSAELFSLTYGAVVTQLLKDYEDVAAANVQLEKMGYNMGVRMVDELLAKASLAQCASFSETAEVVAKVGFKMFLGVNVEVAAATSSEFRLLLSENPLAECRGAVASPPSSAASQPGRPRVGSSSSQRSTPSWSTLACSAACCAGRSRWLSALACRRVGCMWPSAAATPPPV